MSSLPQRLDVDTSTYLSYAISLRRIGQVVTAAASGATGISSVRETAESYWHGDAAVAFHRHIALRVDACAELAKFTEAAVDAISEFIAAADAAAERYNAAASDLTELILNYPEATNLIEAAADYCRAQLTALRTAEEQLSGRLLQLDIFAWLRSGAITILDGAADVVDTANSALHWLNDELSQFFGGGPLVPGKPPIDLFQPAPPGTGGIDASGWERGNKFTLQIPLRGKMFSIGLGGGDKIDYTNHADGTVTVAVTTEGHLGVEAGDKSPILDIKAGLEGTETYTHTYRFANARGADAFVDGYQSRRLDEAGQHYLSSWEPFRDKSTVQYDAAFDAEASGATKFGTEVEGSLGGKAGTSINLDTRSVTTFTKMEGSISFERPNSAGPPLSGNGGFEGSLEVRHTTDADGTFSEFSVEREVGTEFNGGAEATAGSAGGSRSPAGSLDLFGGPESTLKATLANPQAGDAALMRDVEAAVVAGDTARLEQLRAAHPDRIGLEQYDSLVGGGKVSLDTPIFDYEHNEKGTHTVDYEVWEAGKDWPATPQNQPPSKGISVPVPTP